jgi:hypothetical protein
LVTRKLKPGLDFKWETHIILKRELGAPSQNQKIKISCFSIALDFLIDQKTIVLFQQQKKPSRQHQNLVLSRLR